ncbi:MAG: rhodanese-like domain-containing protein [Burkholderiaceae bacterium]
MPITISSKQLVEQAMAEVKTYSVAQAREKVGDPAMQFVDIRDIRELAEGTIVGALHAPRGMLEFWVDPGSPYHKPVFADENKEYVLFCGLGWRSALAAKALQDMGMRNVAHIEGGWTEWVKAGAPTETLEAQKVRRAKAKE